MRRPALVLVALTTSVLTACSGDPGEPTTAGAERQVEITHDLGALTLDGTAQRVVTTSDEGTELLVALGLQPVGAGSTRVDPTAAEPFADAYYIDAGRLGDPEFVGGAELDLEAIAALGPDLIVHGGEDELVGSLEGIAPTAVFDVSVPGAWQDAITELGEATDRTDEARSAIDDHEQAVARAREALAPVVEQFPRVGIIYPQYRGGEDNFLFGEEFALASVVPDLGFELAGSDRAEDAFPGVQPVSSELYSSIDADLLLALGTQPWQETTSEPTLSALAIPIVAVPLDDGQPSAGPLTSPALLERYVTALGAVG
jgi:ABC-type Fe3+-hydroxamate transport system substrate-binding protein